MEEKKVEVALSSRDLRSITILRISVRAIRQFGSPSHITHLKRATQHRSGSGISVQHKWYSTHVSRHHIKRTQNITRDAYAPHKMHKKLSQHPPCTSGRAGRGRRVLSSVPPLTPREWSHTRSLGGHTQGDECCCASAWSPGGGGGPPGALRSDSSVARRSCSSNSASSEG